MGTLAGPPAAVCSCHPRLACCTPALCPPSQSAEASLPDNGINYHINPTRHMCIRVIGQADPALSASACAVRRCPCDSKLATTAAGAAVTTSRHTGVETPADARPTAAPSSDRVISKTDA